MIFKPVRPHPLPPPPTVAELLEQAEDRLKAVHLTPVEANAIMKAAARLVELAPTRVRYEPGQDIDSHREEGDAAEGAEPPSFDPPHKRQFSIALTAQHEGYTVTRKNLTLSATAFRATVKTPGGALSTRTTFWERMDPNDTVDLALLFIDFLLHRKGDGWT